MGYLSMTREDGLMHYQPFLVNKQASDTIMSAEAIMQSCPDFYLYRQEGFKDKFPGLLAFYDASQTLLLRLTLHKKNGLYYCLINTVATDTSPVRAQISQAAISNYMDQLNAGISDKDYIPPSFTPSPKFCPCLPPISETAEFLSPILDPLA